MFTKLLPEPDQDEGKGDESQEVGFEFFIASGDSAELFEFVIPILIRLTQVATFKEVTSIGARNVSL